MKQLLFISLGTLLLFSCEKKELPVDPATSQALTAGMGDDYSNMLYFNILSGQFVKQLPHFGYDLQFEAGPNGKYIYLNSSNFMLIRNRGVVPFESVTDTSGSTDWLYDFPTGERNRTAIGDWFNPDGSSKAEVFVLHRGYDEEGIEIGFNKLQILECTEDYYKLRVGSLDNTQDTVVTIQKNEEKNFIQFWMDSLGEEDIEPNKNDWHFHFTQYTDYDIEDNGDTLMYLVRGVLINQYNTRIAKIENADWDNIDLESSKNLTFSNFRNAIGYDWKAFSLNTGIYEVLPGIVYIIEERGGNYYKLRFVDYYNDDGEKGYAKFEIIGL